MPTKAVIPFFFLILRNKKRGKFTKRCIRRHYCITGTKTKSSSRNSGELFEGSKLSPGKLVNQYLKTQ